MGMAPFMPPPTRLSRARLRGFLGLYALSMMRDGPIYGFEVVSRIAERTGGSWRPGAGAVYPTLRSLVQRKLASAHPAGSRTLYRITPRGRAHYEKIVGGFRGPSRWMGDGWRLVLDMIDPSRIPEFLLRRLRTDMTMIRELVEGEDPRIPPARRGHLREALVGELRETLSAMEAASSARPVSPNGRQKEEPSP